MAATFNDYPIQGTQYRVEFPYLARPFVLVYLTSSDPLVTPRLLRLNSEYTFMSPYLINISVSMAGYNGVRLVRQTSSTPLVNFVDSSALTAVDLTVSEVQSIHIAEEARDQTFSMTKEMVDAARAYLDEIEKSLEEINKILANGFNPVGSFESGAEVTIRNDTVSLGFGSSIQYFQWFGQLPKTVPAGSTPESTGGLGKGKWVPVGDGQLRSEITVLDSIKDLLSSAQGLGTVRPVKGYISGTDFGGGDFLWDPTCPRYKHNGITIFSPTVPFSGLYSDVPSFHAGVGETAPAETGCWRRKDCGRKLLLAWGGVDVSGTQPVDAILTSMCSYAHNTRQILDAEPNDELQAGFSTGTQTKDKFNTFTQASVVLENKYVTLRGNGAKIKTYHPIHKERSMFVLRNGGYNISGFKWNDGYTDFSIAPSDTQHKQGEWWLGIVADGGVTLVAEDNEVTAAQCFVRADVFNGTSWNERVSVRKNKFSYVTNYCFLSRKLRHYEFSYNEVRHNGREWHTYGEACAPTTYTTHSVIRSNNFYNQIAIQSCITPGSYHESCLIVNNHCESYQGIFVEIGSSSNISILNNSSYSTGERNGAHILLVSGDVDGEPAGGLSNLIINGNVFKGGGMVVREYNTGTPKRWGISITNNHMIDCPLPTMTNSAYNCITFSGNYCEPPADFPFLAIGGRNPIIENNVLRGVSIKIRDLGYHIVGLTVRNNKFVDGATVQNFTAAIDMNYYSRLVAEGNDFTYYTCQSILALPINSVEVGFHRLGSAEGLKDNPTELFGAKLTDAFAGDFVACSDPLSQGAYGWVMMNVPNKTWGKITLAT